MVAQAADKVVARANAVKILKKLPVFKGLLEEEYFKVLGMCSSGVLRKEEILFNQGDDGNSMFIMLSGEINIIVDGIGVVHVMKPGEVLGEIGLVCKTQRTATAMALKDSVYLQLYSEILHEVIKKYPRIGYVIMRNIARILAERLRDQNKAK